MSKEVIGHCGRTGRQARAIFRASLDSEGLNFVLPKSPEQNKARIIGDAQDHIRGCRCCLGKIDHYRYTNPDTTYPLTDLNYYLTRRPEMLVIETTHQTQKTPPPTVGDGWDEVRKLDMYEDTIKYYKAEGFSADEIVRLYTT